MIATPEGADDAGRGSLADNDLVAKAARALADGEVIAIPTDTVYGLAARIDRPEAIARLYSIKSRSTAKAIPVLLGTLAHLELVTESITPPVIVLAQTFWPGALTMVVAARDGLPDPLTATGSAGFRTVAVRIPEHDLACRIIDAAGGGLAVTSANVSGEEPATTADQVVTAVGDELGMIVDGGPARVGVPSTIVDVSGPAIEIVRLGAIPFEAIHSALDDRGTYPGQGGTCAV